MVPTLGIGELDLGFSILPRGLRLAGWHDQKILVSSHLSLRGLVLLCQ